MAGFVPNAYSAVLLEALVGRTAISTATVYLGLATGLPSDPLTVTLGNIQEVGTAGYARKSIPAFNAASTVAPVSITTPTAFSFNALTADMTIPAIYGFITDQATGTSGLIRYVFELAEPLLGKSGEPITVPADQLIIQ